MDFSDLAALDIDEKLQKKLAKLNVRNPLGLAFHLPRQYQDKTKITQINALQVGTEALVEGNIIKSEILYGRQRMLVCYLQDATGKMLLRFFHFNNQQYGYMQAGRKIRCFGEIRYYKNQFEISHPEYKILPNNQEPTKLEKNLTPVYPLVSGVTQYSLRALIKKALQYLDDKDAFVELLPADILQKFNFPTLKEAVHYVHYPDENADKGLLFAMRHIMQSRLILEELVAQRLSMRYTRIQKKLLKAPKFQASTQLANQFLQNLKFELTGAQKRVVSELTTDLRKDTAMLRLLQGDVGSGKTVVAAIIMLQAVAAGYQTTLMAPTEILAEQHYQNFVNWFKPLDIKVVCLTGSLRTKVKRSVIEDIKLGRAQIILGTHAIFQKQVEFKNLGLIVVDEQHRFGVGQRHALQLKGRHNENVCPHQLFMTATPIPRSLAMTAYADLDLSVIDELPPNRTPIQTVAVANGRREKVIRRIKEVCKQGRQVYWVCTLITESEVLNCEAAEDTAKKLQDELPELRIGILHGKMYAALKEEIMQEFKEHKLDVLVATTVIEVGVDIPNASIMIIENSERLGLSQLHQLRGRVGRGDLKSYCVLLYQEPLSQIAQQRLGIICNTTDGFKISEQDLLIRGPGEVLGIKQSGMMEFKIAALPRDSKFLDQAKEITEHITKSQPNLILPLVQRWVGNHKSYANV
ncbi:MAG: ATP-dependent DNA helicase RecG [Thiotrichales bacterium]|nr:MAG: ATP-dependent DNA helicase RecG [Thiotrichales bacterium]